jgi:ribosomal protein L12E/L44/L45/RPP1/RPP2
MQTYEITNNCGAKPEAWAARRRDRRKEQQQQQQDEVKEDDEDKKDEEDPSVRLLFSVHCACRP